MKKFRYIIPVLVIILDRITKYIVSSTMYVGESIDVIKKVFSFTYVQNEGAAFGSFKGNSIVLKLLPILLIILSIIIMEKYISSHWTFILSLSLVIGGGIGNLFDRVFLGYVVDMFDFHFWPVFNVADIAVCVGCGFLVLYALVFEKKEKNE